MNPTIAVLIPCYNEQESIAKVVANFKQHLPGCRVFVYDNASTDDTIARATAAGAVVRTESLKGKGNVVRRMFADIEADVYVMVDGDGTYDAASAPLFVHRLLHESLDLVSGLRVETNVAAYRRGHRFGNWMLTSLVANIFGKRFKDMLSGYRVMSRRLVKSFPTLSAGFDIETELTVHALQMRVPFEELPTPYGDRAEGSVSKLNTISDGFRILGAIGTLIREERPMQFFGSIGALLVVVAIGLGMPVVFDYLHTGFVPRIPTAILCAALILLGFLCLFCGLILQTVTRGRLELKRLHYLSVPLRSMS